MAKRNERHQIESIYPLLAGPAARTVDGEGLALVTGGPGKKASWVFRYTSPKTGKPTNITAGRCWLGTDGKVAGMDLEAARKWHDEQMEVVTAGKDPVIEREQQAAQEQAQQQEQAEAKVRQAEEKALADKQAAKVKKYCAAFQAWRTSSGKPRHEDMPKPPKDSFADATDRYCDSLMGVLDPKTIQGIRWNLTKHAFPHFGHLHCDAVSPSDIAKMDKASASTLYALEDARRFCTDVFKWALEPAQEGLRTKPHPVFAPNKTLFARMGKTKHHPALIEEDDIRELLRRINAPLEHHAEAKVWHIKAAESGRKVLQLLGYTGQRIEATIKARREHFALDTGTWTIPAVNQKGDFLPKQDPDAKPHIVYLCSQAVAMLEQWFAANPGSEWAFPGGFDVAHVSYSVVERLLKKLGYEGKHTPHGFRAMLRSAGEDYAGLDALVLEGMGLGHHAAKEKAAQMTEMRKIVLEILEDKVTDEKVLTGGHGETYYRKTMARRMSWEQKCRATMQGWGDWLQELQRPQLRLAA